MTSFRHKKILYAENVRRVWDDMSSQQSSCAQSTFDAEHELQKKIQEVRNIGVEIAALETERQKTLDECFAIAREHGLHFFWG